MLSQFEMYKDNPRLKHSIYSSLVISIISPLTQVQAAFRPYASDFIEAVPRIMDMDSVQEADSMLLFCRLAYKQGYRAQPLKNAESLINRCFKLFSSSSYSVKLRAIQLLCVMVPTDSSHGAFILGNYTNRIVVHFSVEDVRIK